ncbi:MAG TPA: FAD-binding oxidoreductase [bacterium]|nr:FAD-binding oxidoreductase [bacterium]
MDRLKNIFSRDIEPSDRYLADESRMQGGDASKVLFPENSVEVAEILKYSSLNKIPVTIYAQGTGITGASVPFGGIVISLERMNKIGEIELDAESGEHFVKAAACATLNGIKEKLNGTELFYPVDPTEMSASIGGTVATNASGALSFRYGPTRKWIRSIEIVLMDGSIHKIVRGENFADDPGLFNISGKKFNIPGYKMPKCKNAAGLFSENAMDIIDLFIGSEGILGVITEVEIWLAPKHASISVVKFFDTEIEAIDFTAYLKDSKDVMLDFIEYFNGSGLEMIREKAKKDPQSVSMPKISDNANAALFFDIEIKDSNINAAFNKLLSLNVDWKCSWCAWENIEKERIKNFRHALPETVNEYIAGVKKKHPSIHKLGTDFAVSDEKFGELVEFYDSVLNRSGLKYVSFGHIGDNHLHINFLPSNYDELEKGKEIYKVIAEKVIELNGSVSAEHGIGKLKHRYLEMMYGAEGIREMRRIKSVFDPHFLLNRGNMFPCGEL